MRARTPLTRHSGRKSRGQGTTGHRIAARAQGTANSPRAQITNQRTVEVFRDLGIEELRSVATPQQADEQQRLDRRLRRHADRPPSDLGYFARAQADYEQVSPSEMCNAPQICFEPVLVGAARERGAEFLFNTERLQFSQHAERVTLLLGDRATDERITVHACYAIGADCGNSTVATQCGFEMEGQLGLGAAVNCWLARCRG